MSVGKENRNPLRNPFDYLLTACHAVACHGFAAFFLYNYHKMTINRKSRDFRFFVIFSRFFEAVTLDINHTETLVVLRYSFDKSNFFHVFVTNCHSMVVM